MNAENQHLQKLGGFTLKNLHSNRVFCLFVFSKYEPSTKAFIREIIILYRIFLTQFEFSFLENELSSLEILVVVLVMTIDCHAGIYLSTI